MSIIVQWKGGHQCSLEFKGKVMECALGKNGVAKVGEKLEGDGKTPAGVYPLRRTFYREDRLGASFGKEINSTFLAATPTQQNYVWVDDPESNLYNTFATLPLPTSSPTSSYENLYLTDSSVYDVCVVIGYNDDPIEAGKGSAIFFHIASPNYGPTAGCISISLENMKWILSQIEEETFISIS